jgi:hypothetical protein
MSDVFQQSEDGYNVRDADVDLAISDHERAKVTAQSEPIASAGCLVGAAELGHQAGAPKQRRE